MSTHAMLHTASSRTLFRTFDRLRRVHARHPETLAASPSKQRHALRLMARELQRRGADLNFAV